MTILNKFNDLSLRIKLAAMLAPLVIGLLIFIVQDVISGVAERRDMSELNELTGFAKSVNEVVHESQKERGRTGLFMGSGGENFAAELADQRALTDTRRRELDHFLLNFNAAKFGPEFEQRFDLAMSELAGLDAHRTSVDALSLPTSAGISYYPRLNVNILKATAYITKLSTNAELSQLVNTFVSFSGAKEKAGNERAVMSGAFSRGHFDGEFARFAELVAQQNTYLDTFEEFANAEQLAIYTTTVSGTPVAEVDRMRAIAFANSTAADLAGVPAGDWFDQITAKINLMKVVEDELAADVVAKASALQTGARNSLITSSVLGAVVLVISAVIAVYVAQRIRLPLLAVVERLQDLRKNDVGAIQNGMAALAAGDLTVAAEVSTEEIATYQKDEIGLAVATANEIIVAMAATAASFNEAREGLGSMVGAVNENATKILLASDQLGGASTQMASASGQIASAITEVSNSAVGLTALAQESAREVEQVAAGSEQLTASARSNAEAADQSRDEASQMGERIGTVSEASERVAGSADESRTAAVEGQQSVAQAVDSMQAIASAVGRASEKVNELGEYGEQIGNIVQTIDEIAAQTNLLALNAAIEAARAGEQGRGFAVVADNVRTLAERSSNATKEIADLIAKVQDGTKEAVDAMEAGVRDVGAGREITSQAGEALESIIASVQRSAEQMQGIASDVQDLAGGASRIVEAADGMATIARESAAGAEEMAQGTQKVNEAILQVSSTSEETSASTEEVSASTEELSAQAQEVSATAAEMKSLADALNEVSSRFRLQAEGA